MARAGDTRGRHRQGKRSGKRSGEDKVRVGPIRKAQSRAERLEGADRQEPEAFNAARRAQIAEDVDIAPPARQEPPSKRQMRPKPESAASQSDEPDPRRVREPMTAAPERTNRLAKERERTSRAAATGPKRRATAKFDGATFGASNPSPDRSSSSSLGSTTRPKRARRWLRFALPMAAALLLGAVFWFSQAPGDGDGPTVMEGLTIAAGMELSNPRYTGSTAANEPYRFSADSARPNGPDPTEIELDNIVGGITLQDGREVSLKAAEGLWLRETNRLRLTGGVVVSTADGYVLRTDAALADIDSSEVISEGAIHGSGPVGEITAGRARVTGQKDIVGYFDGGVKVTITKLVESRATGE